MIHDPRTNVSIASAIEGTMLPDIIAVSEFSDPRANDRILNQIEGTMFPDIIAVPGFSDIPKPTFLS